MKRHVSIMTQEICDAIPDNAERIVDATLGHGGHMAAMVQAHPQAQFRGIDRDSEILSQAQTYLHQDITANMLDHISFFHTNYTQIPNLLRTQQDTR